MRGPGRRRSRSRRCPPPQPGDPAGGALRAAAALPPAGRAPRAPPPLRAGAEGKGGGPAAPGTPRPARRRSPGISGGAEGGGLPGQLLAKTRWGFLPLSPGCGVGVAGRGGRCRPGRGAVPGRPPPLQRQPWLL